MLKQNLVYSFLQGSYSSFSRFKSKFFKLALLATSFMFLASLLSGNVSASEGINPQCPSVYGAQCPSTALSLDKKIRHPQSGELLDTLSSNDANFLPGQEVTFRVEVRNTGSAELQNISVSDKLPDFVDFVSGGGNFDQNSKTLSWSIDKLGAGASKQFHIKVKVKAKEHLPDMGLTCVTNFSEAKKDNLAASDTAAFCVQTKVLGITTELPKTGFGGLEAGLTTTIVTSLLAIYFARKSRKVSI